MTEGIGYTNKLEEYVNKNNNFYQHIPLSKDSAKTFLSQPVSDLLYYL